MINRSEHQINLCANVEITRLLPVIQQRGLSHTVVIVPLMARAANTLPKFRRHIRGEQLAFIQKRLQPSNP